MSANPQSSYRSGNLVGAGTARDQQQIAAPTITTLVNRIEHLIGEAHNSVARLGNAADRIVLRPMEPVSVGKAEATRSRNALDERLQDIAHSLSVLLDRANAVAAQLDAAV